MKNKLFKNKEYRTIAYTTSKILPSQCIVILSGFMPGIISSLLAYNFLDSNTLAIISYADPLKTLITAISCIITAGYSVLLGRYTGSGDSKNINRVYTVGILFCVILGLLTTLIYELWTIPIANLFGVPSEGTNCFVEYTRGWGIIAIPMLLIIVHIITLPVFSQQKCVYFYVPLFIIVNVSIGYLLVDVLEMGPFGLGLASSVSSIVSFLFMYFWLRASSSNIKFSASLFSFSELLKMITIGSPLSIGYILIAVKDIIRNMFATQLGGMSAVAAISVTLSASSFFETIPLGISGAITIIASMFIGTKNKKKLIDLIRYYLKYILILNTITAFIWFISFHWMCSLFTDDPNIYGIALRFAMYTFVYFLISPICKSLILLYQCLERVFLCNVLYLFHYLIFRVVIMWSLSPVIGLDAVWLSYVLNEVCCFAMLYLLCAFKKRGLPNSISDFLWLGNEFDKVKNITCYASSPDEVILCSRNVYQHLNSININDNRKQLTSLAIEEIGIDVFTNNCSPKHLNKCFCEFIVIYDMDNIFLQIIDNADMFSSKEFETIVQSDDPTFHFGVRNIIKLSKDIYYQNVASLNVYTVKF